MSTAQLQGMALAKALDPDLAQWAQSLVETASLEAGPDDADLGERSLNRGRGTTSVRCRRLALEEELGALFFTSQRESESTTQVRETMSDSTGNLAEHGKQIPFRHRLAALMRASLDAWERATRKTRIDLAEASGIWRITIDDGRLRVRAMDRYLSLDTVPERPRWREVLRTAYFVLAEVPIEPQQRQQIEAMVEDVLRQARS